MQPLPLSPRTPSRPSQPPLVPLGFQPSLQAQLDTLTLQLSLKTQQLHSLHSKHSSLQNQYHVLQDFANDLDRQRKFLADKLASIQIHTQGDEIVGELENKLVLMSTEIMRLGQVNRNKVQQINQIRYRMRELQGSCQRMERELAERDRAIIGYRQRVRVLQRGLHQTSVNKQYENQSTYRLLSSEIERLNLQLNDKIEQIRALEYRIKTMNESMSRLEGSRNREDKGGELQMELERLKRVSANDRQEIKQLEDNVKKVRKENKQLSEQNQRLKRSIKKLEQEYQQTKKTQVHNQNEKIRIQIETSQKTIRQQNNLITQLQTKTTNQLKQRQKMLRKQFEQQIVELRLSLNHSQSKGNKLQTDLQRYEEKLVMLSQQVQRLLQQNSKVQQENVQLKRLEYKIESKQREIKQMIRNRQSATLQIQRDKQTIDRLKQQLSEANTINKQLHKEKLKTRALEDQIQILQQRYQQKQRQYRLLQSKQLQSPVLAYRQKQLELQLEAQRNSYRLKKQQIAHAYEKQKRSLEEIIGQLEDKIRELSSTQSTTQNNYLILAEEIRRLNEVLSEANGKILAYKREISLLQSNLQTAERSLEKMKGMYMANGQLERQLEKRTEIYTKQLKILQQQAQKNRYRLHELGTNCQNLQQENSNLKINLTQVKSALKMKESQLYELIQDVRRGKLTQDNLIAMVREIKQSNHRLQRKLIEIEQDYMSRLQQKSNEKQNLETQYVSYNRRIRDLEGESGRYKLEVAALQTRVELLVKRQKQLEAQNRKLQDKYEYEFKEKSFSYRSADQQTRERLSEYQQEIKRNSRYIGELEAELRNKKQAINKLEVNVQRLQNQNYRIRAEKQDLQTSRVRQDNLRVQQYKSTINTQLHQISVLKQHIHGLKQAITRQQSILSQKTTLINKYQQKLALLSQQLQRINTVIYNKNAQIQQLQSQLSDNNSKKNAKSQIEQLQANNKQTIQVLTVEITRLNTEMCHCLEQIREMQGGIEGKSREIKRLTEANRRNEQILRDKIFELQQQNQRILQNNYKINASANVTTKRLEDYQKYQKQVQLLRNKITQLNSQKNKSKYSIADLQAQLTALRNAQQQQNNSQSSVNILQMTITQLQQKNRQLEKKVLTLVTQNQQLVSQVHNLNRQISKSDVQIVQAKKQLIRIKNDFSNLQRQKQKYKIMSEQIMSKVSTFSLTRNTLDHSDKQAYQFRIRHLQNVTKEYQTQLQFMKQQSGPSQPIIPQSQLHQKYTILQSLHLKLRHQQAGLRQQLNEYQFKMRKLRSQFDLLTKMTHQYRNQNTYLRSQNHPHCLYIGNGTNNGVNKGANNNNGSNSANTQLMLIKVHRLQLQQQTFAVEIDRLNILNEGLRREVEEGRLRAAGEGHWRDRCEEMMVQVVVMGVEMEAMRGRLVLHGQ